MLTKGLTQKQSVRMGSCAWACKVSVRSKLRSAHRQAKTPYPNRDMSRDTLIVPKFPYEGYPVKPCGCIRVPQTGAPKSLKACARRNFNHARSCSFEAKRGG